MADWQEMPDLRKESFKPLYLQLADFLHEFIIQNQLKVGTLLPSETELMTRYRVSRTTVRQAMQRLESLGVVEKQRSRGTFVSGMAHRSTIKGFKAIEETFGQQGSEVHNVVLSYETVGAPDWALGLAVSPGEEIKLLRRLKMAEGKPFALEERAILPEVAVGLNEDEINNKSIFFAVSDSLDRGIVEVSYRILATTPPDEIRKLIQSPPGASTLVRQGIYFGLEDNRVIMISRMFFHADQVELAFDFKKRAENWEMVALNMSFPRPKSVG